MEEHGVGPVIAMAVTKGKGRKHLMLEITNNLPRAAIDEVMLNHRAQVLPVPRAV